MPFDRASAEEELRADLRIRQAVPRQRGDLLLLWSELIARDVATPSHVLSCGDQFAARTFSERLHPYRHEHVVSCMQLLARVDASAFATQPLAVEQMCAGMLWT